MAQSFGSEAHARSVTWLHLSDLHFEPDSSFDRKTVLSALLQLVADYRAHGLWVPDLVLVTGDIANRGADIEYQQASLFFDSLLATAQLEKSRLFVVPGNHDVDRSQGWLLTRTLQSEEESDRFFSDYDNARHLAKLRAFCNWHQSYFHEVHRTDPYSCCAVPSLVTVRSVRLGLLPMSTATFCLDDNDHGKLWLGRSWLDEALGRLDDLDPDVRLALVHHPLDWLHDEERGQVKAQLFKRVDVLLRGHLHDTEAEATASSTRGVLQLAAGACYQAPRWPKRALFARVQLDQLEVQVHPIRYEKNPYRRWALDTSLFPEQTPSYENSFALRSKPRRLQDPTGPNPAVGSAPQPLSRAATHSRFWTVSPDGIAEVLVQLTDVDVHDELILTQLVRPFCNVFGAPVGQSPDDGGQPQVLHEELPEGTPRYRLIGTRRYSSFEWRYRFSNGFALHQTDLQLMGPKHPWPARPLENAVARPVTIHFECDKLHFELAFEGHEDIIEKAFALVERWNTHPGQEGWVRVRDEENRCQVQSKPRQAILEVDRPVLGYRYALAYQLHRPGWLIPQEVLRFTEDIRKACRGRISHPGDLPSILTHSVEAACLPALGGDLGSQAAWLGLLWHPERQLLLTNFGRFPNQSWNVRFPYGSGVAGHGFRFGQTATWFRGDGSTQSLIYQPKTDNGNLHAYEVDWVVCVPILIHTKGPAIGVVSFASPSVETEADQTLRNFAQDAAQQSASEKVLQFRSKLLTLVNAGFWDGLASTKTISSALRDFARRTLLNLSQSSH